MTLKQKEGIIYDYFVKKNYIPNTKKAFEESIKNVVKLNKKELNYFFFHMELGDVQEEIGRRIRYSIQDQLEEFDGDTKKLSEKLSDICNFINPQDCEEQFKKHIGYCKSNKNLTYCNYAISRNYFLNIYFDVHEQYVDDVEIYYKNGEDVHGIFR